MNIYICIYIYIYIYSFLIHYIRMNSKDYFRANNLSLQSILVIQQTIEGQDTNTYTKSKNICTNIKLIQNYISIEFR